MAPCSAEWTKRYHLAFEASLEPTVNNYAAGLIVNGVHDRPGHEEDPFGALNGHTPHSGVCATPWQFGFGL